jgi:hypothetical protein
LVLNNNNNKKKKEKEKKTIDNNKQLQVAWKRSQRRGNHASDNEN